jgi:hypothetical protein
LEYSPDARLTIVGSNLNAPAVSVEFDDHLTASISPSEVSDKRISAVIPTELEPGFIKVKINHFLNSIREEGVIGKQSSFQSNATPFVLAPRILSPRQGKIAKGKELAVEFEPPVSNGKTVFVYLGDNAYPAVPLKNSKSKANSKIGTVAVAIPDGVAPGVYLLRIAVGGATSRLIVDDNPRSPTFGKSVAPFVEVTS